MAEITKAKPLEILEDVVQTICINRTRVQEDMINAFRSDSIINTPIKIVFLDEQEQDAHWVSRDAYSDFWNCFALRNADGELLRVPILSHEYGYEEWRTLGKILVKGYKDERYFPIVLAPAFTAAIIFGEDAVDSNILRDSFLQFLLSDERDTITAALEGKEYDQDILLEVLDRAECHSIPSTTSDMVTAIDSIAHFIFFQEPNYALKTMATVTANLKPVINSVEELLAIYKSLVPTAAKVIALLKIPDDQILTKRQSACFGYLTRFVRGRNALQLKQLLKYLTGADVVCISKIQVEFVVRRGESRIPTVHTSGPLLELPSTYFHYPDFRADWESLLANPNYKQRV